MFRFVFAFLAVMSFAAPAVAVDLEGNPPPFLSQQGGGLEGDIILGKSAGMRSCIGFPAIAHVNIVAGDALIMSTTTASAFAVSKTALATDTTGALTIIGIALTSVSTGETVQVCANGIVRAKVAATVTKGGYLVSSSTTGKLTPVAAVDGTLFLGVSSTALVGYALQSKTITDADPYVTIKVIK